MEEFDYIAQSLVCLHEDNHKKGMKKIYHYFFIV